MVKWINHVAIAAPRNGTTSHTVDPSAGTVAAGALFTPTAGRFLVVLCGGAVTSTTPSGWTLPTGGSIVNNSGLYLWHRTAAGGDTFTTTHNASNYPCIFDVYEFPAGTTFIGSAAAGNVATAGGAGPSLSGLTATSNFRAGVVCQDIFGAVAPSYTWSSGTESVDTGVVASGTDGYGFSVTYLEDQTGATFSTAATSTIGSPTVERLVFAVNAAASGSTITGTLSASTPAIIAGPPTASITGAAAAPVYAGAVAASTPTVTCGPPALAMSGTVAAPTYAGGLAASTAALAVGPPSIALSGTAAPPTYSGAVTASAPQVTIGPPMAAISGTFTAPGSNAVVASLPTVVVGPPASSIAGTVTPPTYVGGLAASLPEVGIGPPALQLAGTVAAPTVTGMLAASLPTITVGPMTAVILDQALPQPTASAERTLTVSAETRTLVVPAESRRLTIAATSRTVIAEPEE